MGSQQLWMTHRLCALIRRAVSDPSGSFALLLSRYLEAKKRTFVS